MPPCYDLVLLTDCEQIFAVFGVIGGMSLACYVTAMSFYIIR